MHLVASEPHYADHLLPIWAALPESMKGDMILGKKHVVIPSDEIILVGGYADVKRHPGNRYIYVEHGAGQSYIGMDHGVGSYYSGGMGHQNCLGFICPNGDVARRWLAKYPTTPSAVVGSPRLDDWHSGHRGKPERDTVAITFHWDAMFTGANETSSAFYWYQDCLIDAITTWRRHGWKVLGHWHPKYPAVEQHWERLNREIGLEVVGDASQILDRASILVADNTSMQAEFLSLGRKVVWLNHPGYRRDVDHGGRFWTWPETFGGTVVNDGPSLVALDLNDVAATTGHPYAFADGLAAQRAASAVQFWLRTAELS